MGLHLWNGAEEVGTVFNFAMFSSNQLERNRSIENSLAIINIWVLIDAVHEITEMEKNEFLAEFLGC